MNRKKIIVASVITACVLSIIIFLMFKVATNHFQSTKEKDPLKVSTSRSAKKRVNENIKVAEKENERLQKVQQYSNLAPGSKPVDDSQTTQKDTSGFTVKVSNEYSLFQNKVLNIDQYIDVKQKLLIGVNELSKLKSTNSLDQYFNDNKSSLNTVFGVTTLEGLLKIKTQVTPLGKIESASIIEDSIKTEKEDVNFILQVKDSNNKISKFKINAFLKDKSCNINWSIN